MDFPVRASLISYTNTKPFVYGLTHDPIIKHQLEIVFDSPSECARKLSSGEVDLGIVPVAALIDLPDCTIVSDYCIGCDGAVNSVFLFSHCPLHEIRTISLDPQSRTSNSLVRILCANHWNLKPQFLEPTETLFEYTSLADSHLPGTHAADACVMIGDRTFSSRLQYAYRFDLGQAWKELTTLPFVFALWASTRPLSEQFKEEFNRALAFGLDYRMELAREMQATGAEKDTFDYRDYLLNKLQYQLDEPKKKALVRYWSYLNELGITGGRVPTLPQFG